VRYLQAVAVLMPDPATSSVNVSQASQDEQGLHRDSAAVVIRSGITAVSRA
jgi:hypothetical protein